MDAQTFIERLSADGISLWLDGNAVRYDGPKGSMTDALLDEMRQLKPEIVKLLSSDPPANSEPPAYIKRCEACGSTNWGCVRTEPEQLPSGEIAFNEIWGCLDCTPPPPADTCPNCCGRNVVTDAVGICCLDCRRRPCQPTKEPEPEARHEPVYVEVNWLKGESGWIELTDPVTGETAAIRAKGLPKEERWLFNRLPQKVHGGSSTSKDESGKYTEDVDKADEIRLEDFHFIGDVKMRETPISSGKKWPWQTDEKPVYPLPERPPVD